MKPGELELWGQKPAASHSRYLSTFRVVSVVLDVQLIERLHALK